MKANITKLIHLSFLFLAPLFTFAQSAISEQLEKYRTSALPEKIFVHTDKNIYAAGENIWFAVYLVDGQTHTPGTLSKTIHVEFQDSAGKILKHIQLFSEGGYASGSLTLKADLQAEQYRLLAYTQYQLNGEKEALFQRNIQVVKGLTEEGVSSANATLPASSVQKTKSSSETEIRLQVFPEGGDCIEGSLCNVAVYVEDGQGKPIAIEGLLNDQNGKGLSKIKTNEFGVGRFVYIPKSGNSYTISSAQIERSVNVPPALKAGYHLSVTNSKERFKVIAKTNKDGGLKGSRMVLHLRGIMLLNQLIEEDLKSAFIEIPEVDLLPGVIVATLFDPEGSPVAERLFFRSPPLEQFSLKVQSDTNRYSNRENVQLKLELGGDYGAKSDSIKGILSYTVLPEKSAGGPQEGNIVTWLLLNSDLNGRVTIPDYLLLSDEKVDKKNIDNFLLTKGWRKFEWKKLASRRKYKPEYLVEQGIYIKGRMGKFEFPKNPRPGKVFLTNMENAYADDVLTEEDGSFVLGPYVLFDTISVLLEGRYKPGKKNLNAKKIEKGDNRFVHLEVDKRKPVEAPFEYKRVASDDESDMVKSFEEISQQMLTISRSYDSLSILLDEVNIEATRISKKEEERKSRTVTYGDPDNRLEIDSIPGATSALSIFELIARVPGVQVRGVRGSETVTIRGVSTINSGTAPLFFVDGTQVDIDFIRFYPVGDLEFIDVVKGPKTAAFGARGANGAILLYTRQGSSEGDNSPTEGALWTKLEGYHRVRTFPKFNPDALGNQNRPDYRTTIHWNPALVLNELGVGYDEFTTSDQDGKFLIIAQGMTTDGRPVYGSAFYEVK